MSTDQGKKERRQMRYSQAELSVLKNTFADNKDLLQALRKFFLQFSVSKSEKALITSTFANRPELFDAVSKTILPFLDENAPFQQIIDLWMTIDIKDKMPEQAYPHFLARSMVIDYLRQQLAVLHGDKDAVEKVKLADLVPSKKEMVAENCVSIYAMITARNSIISHVDMQILQLEVLANFKDETVGQAADRLEKDSTK